MSKGFDGHFYLVACLSHVMLVYFTAAHWVLANKQNIWYDLTCAGLDDDRPLVYWDRETADTHEGDDVTMTCTVTSVNMLDVVRLTLRRRRWSPTTTSSRRRTQRSATIIYATTWPAALPHYSSVFVVRPRLAPVCLSASSPVCFALNLFFSLFLLSPFTLFDAERIVYAIVIASRHGRNSERDKSP